MNWLSTLLLAISTMSPVEAMLSTIIAIYFAYRGGVNLLPKLKKENIKEENKSLMEIHASCPNYTSLVVIIERSMEKSDAIMRIKYQETLFEQMNEAELAWDEVKDTLKDHYSNLLEGRGILEESKIYAIKCYNLIIDSMETETLGLIRRWMKKNHFIEKNTMEYQAYIDDKVDKLHHKITRLIDNSYEEEKMIVPRKELRKSNIEICLPIIQKRTNLFFLRAKEIAIEKNELIKKLKEEIHRIQ